MPPSNDSVISEPDPMLQQRQTICDHGRRLLDEGLAKSTAGNLSIRGPGDVIAISPTAMPYRDLEPDDVPIVNMDSEVIWGGREPATETPMHAAILRSFGDVNGVVHTHSPYATTFASLNRPIPASHYVIAFAGNEIPVAEYRTYGTRELGESAVEALGDTHNACLLQNHGVIATGADLEEAFEIALMVEFCARIHYQAVSIGDPVILEEEELENLKVKFASYGQSGDVNPEHHE